MRMCINEPRTHELPVKKLACYEMWASGPTISNKDVVQCTLVRVVYNERDSSIRFDSQDGAGDVFDDCGS